jgi:multicomponent Na+:H+ antiporter subunit D
MLAFAALCIGLGVAYEPLYGWLPFPVAYVPYTAAHVVEMLQLLLFSGLAFFMMLPWLRRTLTITLDTDWFYRRLGPALARGVGWAIVTVDRAVRARALRALYGALERLGHALGDQGRLARAHTTGGMALWAAALLAAYLVVYYW